MNTIRIAAYLILSLLIAAYLIAGLLLGSLPSLATALLGWLFG
jgi:hypothetical protein